MLANLRSVTTKMLPRTGMRGMSSFDPPEHKLFMQAKPMRR